MLPLSLELKAAALLIALAALFAGYRHFINTEQAKGAAVCEAKHVESDRIEEQRRISAQTEIANESQRMANRRMADAVGLTAAGDGLRNRVTAAIGPGISATAATCGETIAEIRGVCTDLLSKADARLRRLADIADDNYDHGKTCESDYDSLTVRVNSP